MASVALDQALKEIRDRRFSGSVFTEAAALGRAIPDSHLGLINKWTRRQYNAEELYTFPVLAIDDQMTRNYVQYTAETQRETVKAWIGIPFLFNKEGVGQNAFQNADHDLKAASQHGRIYEAKLVRTPQGTTGTLVWVYTVRGATQEIDDFINKLDAGILREVSIHVMATELKCSIDGEAWPCKAEHFPGEAYEGEICFLRTKGPAEPLELSSVACPGSLVAHVMPDDRVSDYQTLKEALGGSLKSLEETMAKKKAAEATASEAANCTCECTECKEAAPHAGEGCTCKAHEEATGVGDGPTSGKKKDNDGDEDEESRTGGAAKKKTDDDDGPEGDAGGSETTTPQAPPAAYDAQSFKLFEGHCPACGRDGESKETVVTMDEGTFKEALDAIRSTSAKTVEKITSQAAEAVKQNLADAELGRKIMSDLRAECVKLAIAAGIKAESDEKAYADEVSALDYSAVRLLRETLSKAEKPKAREEQRKLLELDAKERWNRENGTNVETDAKGRSKTKESRQPRLATKIGPEKAKE